MKCEICGRMKNLVHHHVSYEPEAIQMLCRRCHLKIHWETTGNKRVRSTEFQSKIYNDKKIRNYLKWKRNEQENTSLMSPQDFERRKRFLALLEKTNLPRSLPPSLWRIVGDNPVWQDYVLRMRINWGNAMRGWEENAERVEGVSAS